MTRTFPTILLALALVLAPLPAAAATNAAIDAADEVVTPAAADLPEDTIRYGSEGVPGFAVKLDSQNDTSALEDWANSSDDREILDKPSGPNSTWVLVRADAPDTTGGLGDKAFSAPFVGEFEVPWYFTDGLRERSYVQTVDVEQEMAIPEPVSLRTNQSYQAPDLPLRSKAAGDLGLEDDANPDWLAFSEDTEERSLKEARVAMGDTNVSSTINGTNVTVAPIDTGCNVLGDSLRGRLYGNGTAGSSLRIDNASKSFVSNESVNTSAGNYTAIEDLNGHGSWVTSAIASASTDAYTGVAPDADILCLQALDEDGSGSSHDIARAIRYAANNDADVISLSLGSPVYSQEIAAAVRYATDQGAAVAIAAGNSRQTVRWVASPADTPGDGVVTVGAANSSDSRAGVSETRPAYFSQQGPDNGQTDFSGGVTTEQGVDVVAPGMNVTAGVATADGIRTNETLSGTSMATPLVAGVLAQELEAHPSWQGSPETAAGYLANTTRTMPNASMAAVGEGYVAADKINATNTTGSQKFARTDAAEARDRAWAAASDGSGGLIARIRQRLPI